MPRVAGAVPPGACGPLPALSETGADAVGLLVDSVGAGVVFAAGAQETQSSATAAVPTNAGIYTVQLLRTGKDAPWKVHRLTPPSP